MAERNLDIIIKAHDVYSATLRRADASFSSFSSSVQTSAVRMINLRTVSLAAVGALVGLSYEMFKAAGAAMEAEASEKRLATALGFTSQALLNQAKALQQVTQFGDDEIVGVQATIAAYTQDEETIKSLTQTTLDLAAAKGIDLASAAEMVAKSFGTSTNALGRQGVAVEGVAGSTQRLKEITEGIARFWGGQAAAAGETFAGKLAQTKNAFNDLQEEIGFTLTRNTAFIKAVDLLRQGLERAAQTVRDNQQAIMEWVQSGIVRFIEGVGMAVQVVGFFAQAWNGLKLVGQVVSLAIVDSINLIVRALRVLLTPLDLIYDGMVALGTIEINPFDRLIGGLHEYRDAVVATGADVLVEIDNTQARYAGLVATISNLATQARGWRAETAAAGIASTGGAPTGEGEGVATGFLIGEEDEFASGLAAYNDFLMQRLDLAAQSRGIELEATAEYRDQLKALNESADAEELMAAETTSMSNVMIERQAQNMILASKVGAGNAIVALMSTLGQKYKGMALAAFVVQKAVALGQMFVNTAAAATAAVAPPPMGLGPAAGPALAASIWTWGKINMALVAASSIAEGAMGGGGGGGNAPSVGGGGGGVIGRAMGGMATSDSFAGTSAQEVARPTQNVVINIQNGSGSAEYWQKLAEDNIVPAINAVAERNIKLTLVTA